jgi:hypothetical protein
MSSMHAERKITAHSHKHSFTPYPSVSPYSQMDRITDGETNYSWLGWVTHGSSRLILVGLGNLRFLQVNPGWAG